MHLGNILLYVKIVSACRDRGQSYTSKIGLCTANTAIGLRISLRVEIQKGPSGSYVVSIFAIGPSELANKKTELGAPYN
jgi:hypothetical protein